MANLSNINNKFIVADVATATRVSIGITTTNNLLTLFGTGAGNATVQIEGEGGADPYINFLANNAQHWSLGVDDSDSDKFKLSEHSALGTNDYFVVDTSGKVGIGTNSPAYKLNVEDSASFLFYGATDATTGSVFRLRSNNKAVTIVDIDAAGNSTFAGTGTFTSASSYVLTAKSTDTNAADIFRVVADDDGLVASVSKDASDNGELYVWSGAQAANIQLYGGTGNATFAGSVGIGGGTIEGKLSIDYTAAELPTSGTTSNSAIQVTSSLNNQLNLGLNTVSGDYGAYIQASDNNLAVPYPLNLQPNGGNVGIGTTSPGARLETKAANTGATTDYSTKVIKATAPLIGGYTGTKIISLLSGFDGGIHAVDFGYGYNTVGYDIMLSTNDNTTGDPIERMRITSRGEVGIGITPNVNSNVVNVIQLGKGMTLLGNANDDRATMAANLYLDTGTAFRYVMDGYAGRFSIEDGNMIWGTAGSGTLGAVATVSTKMTLLNNGNVGIGTDSPSSYDADSDNLVVFDTANAGITIATSDLTGKSSIRFSDGTTGSRPYVGGIEYLHSDNSMRFDTGATEKMRIDINGAVGIGDNNVNYKLRVKSDATVANGVYISAGTGSGNHILYVEDKDSTAEHFAVRGDGEIRLNASRVGDVLFGCTALPSASVNGSAFKSDSKNRYTLMQSCNSTALSDLQEFFNPNGAVGKIQTSGFATLFTTSSDYRLKEDLQDFNGLDKVSKIPVYDFKWKIDDTRSYGVIAHELQEVLPDAVSGDKDDEQMQGVDYSKIVPLLVKSIQELKADNDILKSKIETLENK